MAKELMTRAEDYSQWYNDLIIKGDLADYSALKHQGFALQLNALSLLGHYGPQVKEKALKMLDHGLFDFVGTDAHHPGHLKSLQELVLSQKQGLRWEAIVDNQKNVFV